MKLLHLMQDEKVINRTIDLFEAALPGQNKFVVMRPLSRCRYVKYHDNTAFLEYDSEAFWNYVGNTDDYSRIVLHFLDGEKTDFIGRITHPHITWMIWGADMYQGFLTQCGYNLYKEPIFRSKPTLKDYIRRLVKLQWKSKSNEREEFEKRVSVLDKIESVAAMPGDLALLKKYFPQTQKYKLARFFYYPIDEILGEKLKDKSCAGRNILVGNSSSPTGNHVSVFEAIKPYVTGATRVNVILSYGNAQYANFVSGHGRSILGDSFNPIKDFMPIDEYNQLLCGNRYFIYGNLRQEAVGNILVAFALQGTVYLDECNPLYADFKEMGFAVKSLTDIEKEHGLYPISVEQALKNKRIVNEHYSYSNLINFIQTDFQ